MIARRSGEEGTAQGITTDVIQSLREQIREGRYDRGQRLPSERSLSEEFGVSRPTVREAVQALSAMHVVDVRRGSGVYVSDLSVADLLEPVRFALEMSGPTLESLFEVRLALEPLAAGLAAERATSGEVVAMQLCVAQASKPSIAVRRFLELDVELHERIVGAARNPLLTQVIMSTSFLSRTSRERTVRQPEVIAMTRKDHRAIVRAIAAGSRETAARTMRRHLGHVLEAGVRSG